MNKDKDKIAKKYIAKKYIAKNYYKIWLKSKTYNSNNSVIDFFFEKKGVYEIVKLNIGADTPNDSRLLDIVDI